MPGTNSSPLGPGPVRELRQPDRLLCRSHHGGVHRTSAASITAWQRVFGPEFTQPVTKAAESAALTRVLEHAAAGSRPARAPLEEFIEDKGYVLVGGHSMRISALSTGGQVSATPPRSGQCDRWTGAAVLRFRITYCDVPPPYKVWWKVRNTGPEAASIPGGLRGQLLPDDGTSSRSETTKYRGRHYVEAYIVKDGRVVASDHHGVEIR